MYTHIGMTGSRNGMTHQQMVAFELAIDAYHCQSDSKRGDAYWLHHGDCVGADNDAANIADLSGTRIWSHPPIKNDLRAYHAYEKIEAEKNYFVRNRDIVNASEIMYGFPGTMEEQSKGGTWYTINYADSLDKPLRIIYPDGSIEERNM